MKPCQSAGRPCPREAVLTARIAGIGDRPLCRECFATYVSMGMDLRELETNAYQPTWYAQRRFSRDLSGRVA